MKGYVEPYKIFSITLFLSIKCPSILFSLMQSGYRKDIINIINDLRILQLVFYKKFTIFELHVSATKELIFKVLFDQLISLLVYRIHY